MPPSTPCTVALRRVTPHVADHPHHVSRIYLSPPDVGATERQLLLEAFDSNWIAPVGPFVDAFEREIAEIVGVEHVAALSSGTAGLHLALAILGVGPGDEVVVPTLTFVATANAVAYTGASPIFVDADPTSWCIDPDLLSAELDRRAARGRLPKAVITVDLYGRCADYQAISAACERFDIPVVEDAAEALGSSYRDRPAGSFGRMGVISFNGNKIATTGGGGALVSSDPTTIERARHLATQAREPAPHYEHREVGYNYRLSNLLAAVGVGQLRELGERIERRRAIEARYRAGLGAIEGVSFPAPPSDGEVNHWLTVVTIDAERVGATREDIRLALEELDIESRPVWKPMHLQTLHQGRPVCGGAVAQRIFETGLCLPSGSQLTVDDQQRVIDAVRACAPGIHRE